MSNIIDCATCATQIDTDDDIFYGSEINDKAYCLDCYIADRQEASTVFIVGPDYPVDDEPFTVYVSEAFVEDKHAEPIGEPRFNRVYKSTDGWRGYYETSIEEWVEVLGGWTTGTWDDPVSQRKYGFNQWAEALFTGEIVPPVNVAVASDSTSNGFSTAITVYVPSDQVEKFTRWINGELDNLRYALS